MKAIARALLGVCVASCSSGADTGAAPVPSPPPDAASVVAADAAVDVAALPDGSRVSSEAPPSPAPVDAAPGWRVVFEDEFAGAALDTSAWRVYDSEGHAGNGKRSPSAFSVQDGNLVVTAQMVQGVLVSGGMALRTAYTYGRYEFRVRTEADPSGVTSGVVLTWPTSENWPVDGESDIYETGTTPSRTPFGTYIHYDASNKEYGFQHAADGTAWHDMAMEWEESAIRIFRDGALVWTLTDRAAIPRVPHNLCIQLDAFKPSMTGVVHMYVASVRVLAR